jgi:hypothetical protein
VPSSPEAGLVSREAAAGDRRGASTRRDVSLGEGQSKVNVLVGEQSTGTGPTNRRLTVSNSVRGG